MKILFQENGFSGVFYHRQFVPHVCITHIAPDVTIDRTQNINSVPDEKLKTYDIIALHGRIDFRILDRIKKLGVKIVYDVDDIWYCTPEKIFYNEWKLLNHAHNIKTCIKEADVVTTTSDILAHYIKKDTQIIAHVLPNAIAPDDKQFTPIETENKRIRFGFVGGASHVHDVQLLRPVIKILWNEYPELHDQWQIVYGGFDWNEQRFDTRGRQLKVSLKERQCVRIENALTNDFQIIPEGEYKRELKNYAGVDISSDSNYRRIWTRPINMFATIYNEIDVAFAPLTDTTFNRCKSNLKVVEAGWMGKQVIASNIGTFLDGKTDSEIMLCENTEDWVSAMLQHIDCFMSNGKPEQSYLQDRVKEHYNADEIAKQRYELYKTLIDG